MLVLAVRDLPRELEGNYLVVFKEWEPGDQSPGWYVEWFGKDFQAALDRHLDLRHRSHHMGIRSWPVRVVGARTEQVYVHIAGKAPYGPEVMAFYHEAVCAAEGMMRELVEGIVATLPRNPEGHATLTRSLRDAIKNGDGTDPTDRLPESFGESSSDRSGGPMTGLDFWQPAEND